jgi:hypothetical protein
MKLAGKGVKISGLINKNAGSFAPLNMTASKDIGDPTESLRETR